MLGLKELTEHLSPEEYASLSEKVYLDGSTTFGVEHIVRNPNLHQKAVVIVRTDTGVQKTYYL